MSEKFLGDDDTEDVGGDGNGDARSVGDDDDGVGGGLGVLDHDVLMISAGVSGEGLALAQPLRKVTQNAGN